MGKTPIKHTLAGYIIKKTDTEGYRSGKLTGEKHFNKIIEMMEFVGGRRKLIDQARFIENNTQAGHDGKIRINWIQVNSDIKKIDCDVSSIPELCRLEGVEDSRAKQLRLIESVDIMMIFWGVWKPERVSQRLRRICVLSVSML